MAATYKDSPSAGAVNGSNKEFTYDFPVLQTEDVKVALNGVTQATTKYTVSTTPAKITFNNNSVDGTVQESDGAPKSGVTVRVYRETTVGKANGDEDPKAVFAAGSSIRAGDLNANIEQALFGIHEQQEKIIQTEDLADDAVTSAKLDTNIDIAGTLDVTGAATLDSTLSVASNATVGGTLGITGTTTAAAINASGAVGVDGNFDVNTNKFTVNASTGNTVIGGTLNVTGASTLTGSFDANGSATIDNVQIGVSADNEIDTSSGNLVLDSAGGTVQVTDTLDVVGNITVSGTVDGRDVATDGAKLDTAATLTGSETLTNKTLTSPVINDMSGTAVVTSGTSTSDTKVYSAKRADEKYYQKGSADDIEASGVPWSGNDSTVATTAAIDKRIVDIVDDVGGFVALTDEGEIPQYHPEKENTDTADRVGTILSIATLTTTYTPSTGTCTIQASDLSNHAVNATITDCGSTVLSSGYGVLVETKAQTDAQYAAGPSFKFHRLVPKATEVTTVSGSISNVNTVAGAISNVNAVAADISDINAVAADATDIGAVAAKATEIGRLGTADAVADMNTLGTAAIVEDMNLLGTTACVADMALLGDSAVIADMATIADTSNLISNIGTVASAATNVNNVGGSIANVNTVAGNLGTVNDFGARYRAATNNAGEYSSNNDAGDLYFNTDINALKVWTGSAWVAGVTQAGDYAVTTGDTFTGNLKLNDSVELRVGTGDDLKIYHDGSHSYINDTYASGALKLRSNDLRIEQEGGYNMFKAVGGACELYYYASNATSKKFETLSDGVRITGHLKMNDSEDIRLGNDGDLKLRHDGSNSYIKDEGTGDLYIQNGSDNAIICKTNNAVELYYDNAKKFETTSTGVKMPDSAQFELGDGSDLKIFHDGTDSKIDNSQGDILIRAGGGNIHIRPVNAENSILAYPNGAVELYHDNVKKFETTSDGVYSAGMGQFDDGIKLIDNQVARFGTGNDLQIFHDGSNSFIDDTGTGSLVVRSSDFLIRSPASAEVMADFHSDGAVDLYYDNVKKFETTSTGVKYTGVILSGNGWSDDTNQAVQINEYGQLLTKANTGTDVAIAVHQGGNQADDRRFKVTVDGSVYIDSDSAKLKLGDAQDLEIYHDGSNSYIHENGTGDLYIKGDNYINLQNSSGNENKAKFITNGAVELYYDNSKKLETTSTGITVTGKINPTGNIHMPDSVGIKLGASDDLVFWHYSGDNKNYITSANDRTLRIHADNGDETMAQFIPNGAVELYYDNTVRLATNANGIEVNGHVWLGDGEHVKFGAGTNGDLQIYHDGSNSFIKNSTGGLRVLADDFAVNNLANNETIFQAVADGSCDLYYDATLKAKTYSDGFRINGDLWIDNPTNTGKDIWFDASANTFRAYDGVKFTCGTGDDLQIYHDGSNSYINHGGDGDLYLQTHNTADDIYIWSKDDIYLKPQAGESGIDIVGDAHVSLYYDGSQKFYTQSDKCVVAGHFYPEANNTYDLGNASYKWANVYTNDLHLSNEGSSNDVDGTWGDWTLQEGESDLFLKNNRSGKKYKFNLTEVS